MGAIVPRREELSFDQLVSRSNAIALVRPDDPPLVVEEVATGTPPADPSVPHPPIVTYRLGYQRYVVEEWFKPRTGPERIEVESPSNEASMRNAHDAARGMLGHTYPIVLEYVVDVPDAWRPIEARRIVFMGHPGAGTRYPLAYKGLSLGVGAAEAVREATRPPDPPPRRWRWWPF